MLPFARETPSNRLSGAMRWGSSQSESEIVS